MSFDQGRMTTDSRLGDPGHVLAVGVLPQERGCADDDVDTVDTCG